MHPKNHTNPLTKQKKKMTTKLAAMPRTKVTSPIPCNNNNNNNKSTTNNLINLNKPSSLNSCPNNNNNVNNKHHHHRLLMISAKSNGTKQLLRKKWMEYQGLKNWDGLLDPLDDALRNEILRYGRFVESAYRSFDFDTSSPNYATCLYPDSSMLDQTGLGRTGYKVTKTLHAASGIRLPGYCARRVPGWVANQSAYVGYVAVCHDRDEIARLGRRDVVIAFRGTVTCMEWLENLRATLMRLPADMASDGNDNDESASMVQRGFWSLYTSKNNVDDGNSSNGTSLRESIREEIGKILETYADEALSVTITGHSLGAALATLTAYDITSGFKKAPLVTVMSFGGPRVGNGSFRHELERSGTKVLRIVNTDDVITKVPGFLLEENHNNNNNNNDDNSNNNNDDDSNDQAVKWMNNWLKRRVQDTQYWAYAEIGRELRLSSRDCPHLSNGNVATCHDLKTYLHLVDSFVSSNCPLRATAKKVMMNQSI